MSANPMEQVMELLELPGEHRLQLASLPACAAALMGCPGARVKREITNSERTTTGQRFVPGVTEVVTVRLVGLEITCRREPRAATEAEALAFARGGTAVLTLEGVDAVQPL